VSFESRGVSTGVYQGWQELLSCARLRGRRMRLMGGTGLMDGK